MKLRRIFSVIFCFALLLQSAAAFETDQYNLPPRPLADIGDEFSQYAEENLLKAIGKINDEIRRRQFCLDEKTTGKTAQKCEKPDKERARLEFLRSDDAVAREVFKLLGDGIFPFTRSAIWIEKHRFKAQPALYKTDYFSSIYLIVPTSYLTISPTVKIYGAEFGTDKVAHFFQQGYTYFKIVKAAKKKNLSEAEAVRRAIRWGQKTERTYYGTLVSGVYSNADLCANYVGMRFYENLTKEIKINNRIKPPVLLLENGAWTLNPNSILRESLIKPFLTEHLNEALNPSIYTNIFNLRAFVRQTVRKRSCRRWRAQKPDSTRASLNSLTENLRRWNDEDYGFTDSRHIFRIGDVCFDSNQNKPTQH